MCKLWESLFHKWNIYDTVNFSYKFVDTLVVCNDTITNININTTSNEMRRWSLMLKGYKLRWLAKMTFLNKFKYWPENAENIKRSLMKDASLLNRKGNWESSEHKCGALSIWQPSGWLSQCYVCYLKRRWCLHQWSVCFIEKNFQSIA